MKTKNYLIKSWLLMMLMLIGAGGNLWADEVTFTPGTDTGETSVTKNGVTAKMTTMNNASYYQIYANQSATFTISNGTITKIEFTCTASGTSKYGPGNASANVGSYSYSGQKGTWSGSATTVTISSTAQVRMSSLTITYTPSATGPVDPDVSFASNPLSLEVGETATNAINKPSDLNVTYSSGDANVANVNANGAVTGVAEGNTTITASWAAVANTYNAGSKSYTVNVTAATPSTTYVKVTDANQLVAGNEYILVAPKNSMAMGGQNSNYRDEVAVTIADNKVRIKSEDVAVLTLGGEPDAWTFKDADGNYLTLTSDKNEIHTSDAATNNNSKWTIDGDFRVYNKYYTGRCIDHNNSGSRFACYKETYKNAYLYVKEGSAIDDKENASVSIDATSLTVGGETAQITAVPEGLVMSYESSAPAIASVENGVVTGLGHGSATITVSWEEQAVGEKTYNAGSREFEISVVDPNRPGTKTNPYTVAQALEFIETLGTESSDIVYVSGIVSQVDKFDDKYSSITYWISDDGTTSSQLECYSGKGLESADFSSVNDIQVGDIVTVAGTLKKYNDIYEFNYNNYLASFERPVYEITAKSNNEDLGTVSLEGNIITATLKDGSRYADPAFTVDAEGEVTVEQDGNEFVVVAKSNCTVTINFEAIPTHKVTWSINGETSEETVAEGAALSHETPADIDGKTFVGWVIAPIEGELENAPASLITNPVMGTADVTYYAVFASQEGSGDPTWTETALSALTASDTFVIVGNGYAMPHNNGTSSAPTATAVTVDDSNLTSTVTDNIKWNVSGSATEGYTFYPNGDDKKWLYCNTTAASSSNNNMRVGTGDRKVFELDTNGYLVTKDTYTTRYLSLYNDQDFRGYVSTSNGAFVPAFYKYSSNTSYSGYCTTVIKPVAKIGNKGFETLQAAVDAAEAGETIDIVDDFTLTTVTTSPNDKYNVNVNKSVTINGNGHVITSAQGKRALALTGEGNKITIKGLTIVNNKADWCMGILNNLTCTLDATTIDGTGYAGSYNQPLTIGSIDGEGRVTLNITNGSVVKTNDEGTAHYSIIVAHPADITVTESKLIGWANVYLKPDAAGSTVKIEGSEMKSHGLSGNSNNFSILVTEGGNNTIEVKDTKITSSAVEGTYQSLITLGGEGNVVKLLGETTYETNDKTWGAITHNWGSLKNNKLYLDDTTKAAFAEYLDGSHQETIEPADETGLYPVSFEPEVLYYWAVGDSYQGGYYSFADPFKNGWLADGEFIALQKNITLTEDITCQLASGTSFNFLLGDFTADKNGHSVALNTGVTVLSDKQTDIFKAAKAGYVIVETETETGYSYTAEKVMLAQPIIFHDGGEYEGELTVAIAGEGVKYTLNGGAEQTYSAPFTISETTTVKAWAEQDGIKSAEVSKTFTIVEKTYDGETFDSYYTIKNNDKGKFVNVAGRKTVTFVDEDATATAPGTVIRVKTNENGQVEVLRSQGVDLPRYAEKAMNYVPELAKALVERLGENDVIGEDGVNMIADEFKAKFDYHLYLEKVDGGYRIYGKTPSMKHVVDFYANNKEIIDSRLPKLEGFVEDILEKVAERLNHAGSAWASKFKIHDIWTSMGGAETGLTEPVEGNEAAISKFYTEVLSSEKNVWDFAYQTAMIYWTKVEDLVKEHAEQLGDYSKYLTRVKNIKPDFKYYIVVDEAGTSIDFISEGNAYLDTPRTSWTLTPRTDFNVNFDVVQEHKICPVAGGGDPITYPEYYTTLYTDFAYTLPEDGSVKAYKVVHVNDTTGVAIRKEITGTIPAQTPVMLISKTEGNKTLTLSTQDGEAVTGNLLVGADALINEYKINSSTAEGILNMLKSLSESLYNDYEYLARKNSGTVNNKYFFGLTEEDLKLCSYINGNGEKDCVTRTLSNGDKKTGFYSNWEAKANQAFLVSEKFNPILLSLVGDVNRDGTITIGDVTALVNIILGKAKYPDDKDKYDFEAADVNGDSVITIGDVTKLVNIILGKE